MGEQYGKIVINDLFVSFFGLFILQASWQLLVRDYHPLLTIIIVVVFESVIFWLFCSIKRIWISIFVIAKRDKTQNVFTKKTKVLIFLGEALSICFIIITSILVVLRLLGLIGGMFDFIVFLVMLGVAFKLFYSIFYEIFMILE